MALAHLAIVLEPVWPEIVAAAAMTDREKEAALGHIGALAKKSRPEVESA